MHNMSQQEIEYQDLASLFHVTGLLEGELEVLPEIAPDGKCHFSARFSCLNPELTIIAKGRQPYRAMLNLSTLVAAKLRDAFKE